MESSRLVVWMSAWQLQCCGEAFAVGDVVTWDLATAEPDRAWLGKVLGVRRAASVSHAEEHHGGSNLATTPRQGRVERIRAVGCAFAPAADGAAFEPAPHTADIVDLPAAARFDGAGPGKELVGYLVDLRRR